MPDGGFKGGNWGRLLVTVTSWGLQQRPNTPVPGGWMWPSGWNGQVQGLLRCQCGTEQPTANPRQR